MQGYRVGRRRLAHVLLLHASKNFRLGVTRSALISVAAFRAEQRPLGSGPGGGRSGSAATDLEGSGAHRLGFMTVPKGVVGAVPLPRSNVARQLLVIGG